MNEFLLICLYCGYEWVLNNNPSKYTVCLKCKDKNLTIKDLSRTKVDYYAGSPPFEKKKEKEVILQDPFERTDNDYTDDSFGYIPGRWD